MPSRGHHLLGDRQTTDCPTAANGAVCNNKGVCASRGSSAGECECHAAMGYSGDTCEQCAPGFVLFSGACHRVVGPTCTDGMHNGDEAGTDCGGTCPDTCPSPVVGPTCTDGMQNGDEAGTDCGGTCPDSCTSPATTAVGRVMLIAVGCAAMVAFVVVCWCYFHNTSKTSPDQPLPPTLGHGKRTFPPQQGKTPGTRALFMAVHSTVVALGAHVESAPCATLQSQRSCGT